MLSAFSRQHSHSHSVPTLHCSQIRPQSDASLSPDHYCRIARSSARPKTSKEAKRQRIPLWTAYSPFFALLFAESGAAEEHSLLECCHTAAQRRPKLSTARTRLEPTLLANWAALLSTVKETLFLFLWQSCAICWLPLHIDRPNPTSASHTHTQRQPQHCAGCKRTISSS